MTDDIDSICDLRRPDLLLREIAEQHPFDRPRTLLARVDGAYDAQRLVACTVLWEEPPVDELVRTRVTGQALAQLGLSFARAPYRERPLVVPVVVRPGPTWWSADELEVWLGLRYGSNLCDARQGDILTVTPQGWLSQLDDLHGVEPRAVWAEPGVAA